jgi:hypothetical protein
MRSTIFKLAIVFAATLIVAAPAPAFYWTIKTVPSIVNPVPPPPGTDPIPLPPTDPTPGGGGTVPEPATAAAAAIGLMVIGARRLIRRK